MTDIETAHLVEPDMIETYSVMGPTLQFLTPDGGDEAPCIMRGTMPEGLIVPLHSHPEPETFIALSGEVEGLAESQDGFKWMPVRPGNVFHVPGGAKHAWRNWSPGEATAIVVTAPSLGRFFREVGTPVVPDGPPPPPPTEEAVRRFLEIAERYGYWNATPEENAEVGLKLPPLQ
jgi:quercetin dioxygenase-like cupin family protein